MVECAELSSPVIFVKDHILRLEILRPKVQRKKIEKKNPTHALPFPVFTTSFFLTDENLSFICFLLNYWSSANAVFHHSLHVFNLL